MHKKYCKLQLLFLLLFFSSIFLNAQPTFERVYDFEKYGNGLGRTLVAADTGLTILVGGVYRYNDYTYKGLIFIDSEGDSLNTVSVAPPNTAGSFGGGNALIQDSNDDYLVCGSVFYPDSLNYNLIYLHKTDEQGSPLWTKIIGDGAINEFCNNAIQAPDGNYYMYSIEDIRNENNITITSNRILTKISQDGDVLWRKTLQDNETYTLYGNISNTLDSQIIMIYNNDFVLQQEEPVIVKMDTLGNILWQKKLNINDGGSFCGSSTIRPLLDGGYVVSWCKDTIFDWETNTISPYIGLLDSVGNLKKKVYFQSPFIKIIYNIKVTANGDIIGCGGNGNIGLDINNGGSGTSAWLFRMRPTGEILWERNYVSANYYDSVFRFFDVVETNQGGIAATGWVRDTLENGEFNGNVWLVQVDSTGCMFPDCQDELLFLDVAEVEGQEGQGLRQVFFKAFPNPVDNELYLNFYQPIAQQNTRIELYDFSGRLLIQDYASKGSTAHALGVADFPSGMYLLRYVVDGQVSQQEKIIIQH